MWKSTTPNLYACNNAWIAFKKKNTHSTSISTIASDVWICDSRWNKLQPMHFSDTFCHVIEMAVNQIVCISFYHLENYHLENRGKISSPYFVIVFKVGYSQSLLEIDLHRYAMENGTVACNQFMRATVEAFVVCLYLVWLKPFWLNGCI